MKKLLFLSVSIAAITFASCGNKNPYPPVDNDSIPDYVIDSIMNNISDIEDSLSVSDSTFIE